ncbi:hypothetical protein [Streptomyces natalensis]|uniref:Uncharacterized protein n=1 Tax=Streptomyces natalensis ATCC 27448 TaxID=1240678 RepID=A0A0D7CC28_9ACTN|nr:hypothetical protein [Streptomyces natalensis]KIZ13606.1 hypothetical protein SNA_36920 [Streptomyces natalensis ATCC 27448]
MNTTHQKHQKRPKKSVTRILAVSATLGIALAAGTATAASAEAATAPAKAKVDHSRPLGGEGWGGGDCNAGLLSLLCL